MLKVTQQISFKENYQDADDIIMNKKHDEEKKGKKVNETLSAIHYGTWHISSQIIYQTNSQWFQNHLNTPNLISNTRNTDTANSHTQHEYTRERDQVPRIHGNGITV